MITLTSIQPNAKQYPTREEVPYLRSRNQSREGSDNEGSNEDTISQVLTGLVTPYFNEVNGLSELLPKRSNRNSGSGITSTGKRRKHRQTEAQDNASYLMQAMMTTMVQMQEQQRDRERERGRWEQSEEKR